MNIILFISPIRFVVYKETSQVIINICANLLCTFTVSILPGVICVAKKFQTSLLTPNSIADIAIHLHLSVKPGGVYVSHDLLLKTLWNERDASTTIKTLDTQTSRRKEVVSYNLDSHMDPSL